jgi:hypothetical protein
MLSAEYVIPTAIELGILLRKPKTYKIRKYIYTNFDKLKY